MITDLDISRETFLEELSQAVGVPSVYLTKSSNSFKDSINHIIRFNEITNNFLEKIANNWLYDIPRIETLILLIKLGLYK
jgi:hypothetical protein